MTKPNEQPQVPPKQETPEETKCPDCGGKMTKSTFRTGSMGHSPKVTAVCQKCGTRT